MIEPVNTQDFTSQPERRKPDQFEHVKFRIDGGVAELAAFGDLVIATPKARFAQPEISIGIFPPLASTILPFLVGPKIALELVLTGEPVTAERALELGMVNRLVPEAQLEQAVKHLVGRIKGHSRPLLTI